MSTSRWEDRANCNIFNKVRVDLGPGDQGFEGMGQEVSSCSVFESAFTAFGEGGAEGTCYDDIVRRL